MDGHFSICVCSCKFLRDLLQSLDFKAPQTAVRLVGIVYLGWKVSIFWQIDNISNSNIYETLYLLALT